MKQKLCRWWNSNAFFTFFLLAIGLGFCILVVAPLMAYDSICPPKYPTAWRIEANEYAGQGKYEGQELYGLIAHEQKENTDEQHKAPNKPSKRSLPEWLCDETKITDLFLAFFTYCLVAVGFAEMLNTDKTAKKTERAYLTIGGVFGEPRNAKEDGIEKWRRDNRPSAAMFQAPWRITIYNFGKTSGYNMKIEHGFCPEDKFDLKTPVSALIKNKDFANEYMKQETAIQDVFPPTGQTPYQYRHIPVDRDKYLKWIFFGKITYKDIFGDEHYSTFSYRLTEESAEAVGTNLSDDHN